MIHNYYYAALALVILLSAAGSLFSYFRVLQHRYHTPPGKFGLVPKPVEWLRGTVTSYDPEDGVGRIQPDKGGPWVRLKAEALAKVGIAKVLPGQYVQFVIVGPSTDESAEYLTFPPRAQAA